MTGGVTLVSTGFGTLGGTIRAWGGRNAAQLAPPIATQSPTAIALPQINFRLFSFPERGLAALLGGLTGALTTVSGPVRSPLTAEANSSMLAKRFSGSFDSARSRAAHRSTGASGRASKIRGGGSKTCL